MVTQRNTVQLERIRRHLVSNKNHPTAEQIFKYVRKDIPSITLATVYRNLNKLESMGEAIKLEVNGEYRFDGDIAHHEHCICKKCGRIIDLENNRTCKNAMKDIKSSEFKPDSVTVIFRGVCKRCYDKN